jgi:hypothetical protein
MTGGTNNHNETEKAAIESTGSGVPRIQSFGIWFGNDVFTEANLGKTLNAGYWARDGAFTNSAGFNYSTSVSDLWVLGPGVLSASFSNNMYTKYNSMHGANFDPPEYLSTNTLQNRPNLGVTELRAGYLKQKPGDGISNITILEAGLAARDITYTDDLQWFVHQAVSGATNYNYALYPGKTTAAIDVSAAKIYGYSVNLGGKTSFDIMADIGATLGTYTGANTGLQMSVGSSSPEFSSNLKTEYRPLSYAAANDKGWSLSAKYNLNCTAINPLFNKSPERYSESFLSEDYNSIHNVLYFQTDFNKLVQSVDVKASCDIGSVMLEAGVTAYTNTASETRITGTSTEYRGDTELATQDVNYTLPAPKFHTYGYINLAIDLAAAKNGIKKQI